MNRVIIISDLHIHNYKQFNEDGKRLYNILDLIDYVFKFAVKNGITIIILAGDLYDQFGRIEVKVVNGLISTFKRNFATSDVNIYAISGNHDFANKNYLTSPGESALKHLAEIFTDRFMLLDNGNAYFSLAEETTFHGMPYYDDPNDAFKMIEHLVKDINPFGNNVLIMHQDIYPEGHIVESIISPAHKIFKPFDLVFNGHIHKHDILTSKFINIGSPIHRDAGDIGQDKGFIILDTKTLEWKYWIINKYPKFMYKFVDDLVTDDEKGNYIIRQPRPIPQRSETKIEFKTTTDHNELLRDFVREVAPGDEELLQIGLQYI